MKKIYLSLLTLLLFSGIALAQDVRVNAQKIDKQNGYSTDFTRSFSIIFSNATAKPNISVLNEQYQYISLATIKKDQDYIVTISAVKPNLSAKTAGNKTLNLSGINGLAFKINSEDFTVNNKKQDLDGDKKNSVITGSRTSVRVIAVHDAITAYNFVLKGDKGLYPFLAALKNSNETQINEIIKLYDDNIFIRDLLAETKSELAGSRIASQSEGSTDVVKDKLGLGAKAIDAISRLIASRAKKEMTVHFFNDFKDLLNKAEYQDARILFPKTFELLMAIDREIYGYEKYLNALKTAFHQDLEELLANFPSVIKNGRYHAYFQSHRDLKYSTLLGIETANKLLDGKHPGEILENLSENYIDSLETTSVTGSIKTLQLISESLRSKEKDRYWVSTDTLKMLLNPADNKFIAARFYMGFLYERSKGISFGNGNLSNCLNTLARQYTVDKANFRAEITKTIRFLQELSLRCEEIESIIAEIKSKNPHQSNIDIYLKLHRATFSAIDQLNNFTALGFINKPIPETIKTYLSFGRKAGDLAFNIRDKNYNSAALDASNLYLQFLEKKRPDDQSLMSNDHLTDKAGESTKVNKDVDHTAKIIREYGNFMANALEAKTSKELADIIETKILPVGSASIKRKSNYNISLNGYVGPYIGIERIKNLDDHYTGFNSAGLTAPVGISFSKGIDWRKKSSWSASVFFSIIDIGAPVAFRFKDEDTEQIPDIKLKDVVSPGIFLSIGAPRVPLSFNVGYQSGPVLRKLSATATQKAGSSYSRFSISLVLDIPLLNFYTSQNN